MDLEERRKQLEKFQKNIGYEFKDKSLLNQALVHSSFSNENEDYKDHHNERLEFLGDAVLELVISEILFEYYRPNNEGFLTKMRARLVCERSFANLADSLNLSDYLLLGKGEEMTGGRDKRSIKADAFEALCAAIYLDGGFDVIFHFIKIRMKKLIDKINNPKETFVDYKSILQEYMHKRRQSEFKYILSKEEGLPHDKTFYIDVYLNSKKLGSGVGSSKKKAEQNAARNTLIKLGEING